MADLVANRQAFVRIGFTNPAATFLVDEQGVTIDSLRHLGDEDLKALIDGVKKPGGTVLQAGVNVPHPGFPVSPVVMPVLRMVLYWLKFMHTIGRPVAPADVNEANWTSTRYLRQRKEAHTKPEASQMPTIKPVNPSWPAINEAIVNYLGMFIGEGPLGIPLSYVVRARADVPAHAADPRAGYPTLLDELIARAPHAGGDFQQDNAKVAEILAQVYKDTQAWVFAKVALRRRDGRLAFNSVTLQFMGPNTQANQNTLVKSTLNSTFWNGYNSKNWSFDMMVAKQVQCHDELARLHEVDAVAYEGISERSKVAILLASIKTTKCDVIKATILGNQAYLSNYQDSVTLFRDFINSQPEVFKSNNKRTHINISAVNAKGGGTPVYGPKTGIEIRYYKKHEYPKLTDEEKKELKECRAQMGINDGGGKRGNGSGGGRGGNGSNKKPKTTPGKDNKYSKKEFKKLERRIAALEKVDKESSDEEEEQQQKESTSNRNNPALQRNKIKKKRD